MILRSFGNLIYDITFKYNDIVNVKQLRKREKVQIKVKKVELDLTLLKNCQAYNVYPKFLAFNIPHSNRTDDEAIRKRLQLVLKKHGILKRLQNNQEIVILRPDKSNDVVILNRKDYICGMNNIILNLNC